VTTCAYCGRANDAGAQFCKDCGKPLTKAAAFQNSAASLAAPVAPPASPPPAPAAPPVAAPLPGSATGPRPISGAVVAPLAPPTPAPAPAPAAPARPEESAACPFCRQPVRTNQPFCPHCGRRLSAPGSGAACARCGSPSEPGTRFCGTCGAQLTTGDELPSRFEKRVDYSLTLVLLDESGNEVQRFARKTLETAIGRSDGEIRFPDDPFLSPLHARLTWEEDGLVIRDLGSRNGTWVFLTEPHRLIDGEQMLIGSQIFRFRRLGYPGPHSPEHDATKRMGSLIPSADIASLTQLRSDGSARDVAHLSPGRDITIGRERGDWLFPYDPSMSGEHAIIRSEDADFVVIDANSRNGVAIAARGPLPIANGGRVLIGDKLLRVDLS